MVFQLLGGNVKYSYAYLMHSLMLFEFNLAFEIVYLPLRHVHAYFICFYFHHVSNSAKI